MSKKINVSYIVSLLCILLFIYADTAFALAIPQKSKQDQRIQFISYSPDNVVKVNAGNGLITTIVFSPNEQITNFGSGYSTAWEFATDNNQFFLKPKDKDATTNLVIVTNKRIYSFDINLVEKSSNVTYKLVFNYPDEQAQLEKAALEKARLESQLNAPDPNIYADPHLNNCNYTMNFGETPSSKLIAPISAFDDGLFTYLKFKPNTDFPAVYRVSADGEAIINTHIENETLVIHGVYPEFRLRAGKDVVGIYNEDYDKNIGKLSVRHSNTLNNGTSTNGLSRHVRGNNNE